MSGFFCYLLGRDLNPKRETRRCRQAGCVIVDQRHHYYRDRTRQQDTKHTKQASMLSSKTHTMIVYNKGRHAPFGTWVVCQLMARGAVPVARAPESIEENKADASRDRHHWQLLASDRSAEIF
jgi:hypothetical protein